MVAQLSQIQHGFHIYSNSEKKILIEALMNDIDEDTWNKRMSMELGQLAQGKRYVVSATYTIDFVYQNKVPSSNKVTYDNFVADHMPLKT